MPSNEDIAWAAGFYEGEGSCQNSNSRRLGTGRGSIQVIIPQTNREPLDRIKMLFGGSLFLTGAHKKNPNWNPAYQWCIASSRAKLFLNLIYPLLSTKRRFQILKAFMNAPVPLARKGLVKTSEEYRIVNAARERIARAKGLR